MAQQYALDKLGWLQFEQLCSELLELEGGIAHNYWNGSAYRCRYAVSGLATGRAAARLRAASAGARAMCLDAG